MNVNDKRKIRFLDLFAGAGGLSEGFIQAGFDPVAHVEMMPAASYTLKTRMVYHWLKDKKRQEIYKSYLEGKIDRESLYQNVPERVLNSVINETISDDTIDCIFDRIDKLACGNKIDVVVGGPPCQAYSLVGRARDENGMKGDKRNYLFEYYAMFLDRYKPKYFVFENVLGLLSAKDEHGRSYLDVMRTRFREKGYVTKWQLLCASDYGVLQNRKRVILIGRLGDDDFKYPQPSKWNPQVVVGEIFKDLPFIQAGEGSVTPCEVKKYKNDNQWLYASLVKDDTLPVTWHQARGNKKQDLEIYKIAVQQWNNGQQRLVYSDLPESLKTHKNQNAFLDRFKVVAADLPASQTVVAHVSKDGHYYIHPDINQNRSLTPREVARLQTFPDNYFFESESGKPSRTDAYKQIGNAVPVLFAKKIAKALKNQMRRDG